MERYKDNFRAATRIGMSQLLQGEPPPIYRQWVTWLFASPENIAAFRRDPLAATRAAGLKATPEEVTRLLQAVEYVTRATHGHR
jgi:hypothetical protein